VPEGDTIHRAAAALRRALEGETVATCEVRRQTSTTPPAPGTRIERVAAVGKHLLIGFADGRELHTHMGMTGSWHVYRAGERWRKPAHQARVVLTTTNLVSAVCFAAPLVELRAGPGDARNARDAPATRGTRSLAALGPDLSEPDVDLDTVVDRLGDVAAETEIAVVLLDQRVGSGIGNVIKSETCWVERVNPFTALGTLDAATRRRLYARAHALLRASITGRRRATVDGALAVYGRAGKPCPRCRTAVCRAEQDGRSTFWCPKCQP
jgi:endonuclease VIII